MRLAGADQRLPQPAGGRDGAPATQAGRAGERRPSVEAGGGSIGAGPPAGSYAPVAPLIGFEGRQARPLKVGVQRQASSCGRRRVLGAAGAALCDRWHHHANWRDGELPVRDLQEGKLRAGDVIRAGDHLNPPKQLHCCLLLLQSTFLASAPRCFLHTDFLLCCSSTPACSPTLPACSRRRHRRFGCCKARPSPATEDPTTTAARFAARFRPRAPNARRRGSLSAVSRATARGESTARPRRRRRCSARRW